MEKNDEENELGPTGESNNSQETDEGGDTNNNSDSSSDSSEQGNGFYENLSSESSSTVVVSEDIQTVDQDREGIDQDELERAIEKELEEGVKVISKYLDEESEFIKAYQEMVGKKRAIDEVRELKGEGCKMTDEEWEKEVKNATYNAELIYESMEKTEIKPINEEIPENKEDLEIEKEVEQSEEISEPQLSDLKEDVREQEKELEQIYEGREPPLEQHQVEPFIKEALETVPEPIINEKEAEKLQELDIEEQFETVHLNEYVDELVEKEELEAEQLKEQVEKEELEAQTSKIKEANSELYEVVEVERDGLDQHEVEATIEEELKTEPEPIINEKEVEKLQELDIEEQFEMAHLNEFVDELVERQDEDKNIENDKIEQEKENIEQNQEVIHQSTYLQEKLEEQERELELKYEEKDKVEQHQVEAAIEEELKTEPKFIINEEELEYLKNLKLEEQLGAEFFYGFIEKLANRQNEEKEECEEKEDHEEISTEEKVAQIMRELEIPQEINSDDNKVEVNSQEGELEQETTTPDGKMVEQREIEEYKDHQQELEEILEQNRKIEQEALKEIELGEEDLDKTIEKNYERAKNLYKQQTGKRPIYANKETKGFKQWLEQKKKSEEKEKPKQKKELKEEQKKEEIWKWSLKNWIERATEIDPELKSELRKLVEEYDELEKLIKKYSQLYNKAQREKLSQAEKNELKSLIKALQKIDPIKIELFLGIREIKRYLDGQSFFDFWYNPRVNRILHHFFTQLSQKYKSLKQAQKNKENSEEILKNWIEQASEEEISPELKVKLKEIVENYSELEELAIRFMELYGKAQNKQISNAEKSELKLLINTLEKLEPIKIELFTKIRAIKRYLNDQNFDDFYDKMRVYRLLSQVFGNLEQISYNSIDLIRDLKNSKIFQNIENKIDASYWFKKLIDKGLDLTQIETKYLEKLIGEGFKKKHLAQLFEISERDFYNFVFERLKMNFNDVKDEYFYKPKIINLYENGYKASQMASVLSDVKESEIKYGFSKNTIYNSIKRIWNEKFSDFNGDFTALNNYLSNKYRKTEKKEKLTFDEKFKTNLTMHIKILMNSAGFKTIGIQMKLVDSEKIINFFMKYKLYTYLGLKNPIYASAVSLFMYLMFHKDLDTLILNKTKYSKVLSINDDIFSKYYDGYCKRISININEFKDKIFQHFDDLLDKLSINFNISLSEEFKTEIKNRAKELYEYFNKFEISKFKINDIIHKGDYELYHPRYVGAILIHFFKDELEFIYKVSSGNKVTHASLDNLRDLLGIGSTQRLRFLYENRVVIAEKYLKRRLKHRKISDKEILSFLKKNKDKEEVKLVNILLKYSNLNLRKLLKITGVFEGKVNIALENLSETSYYFKLETLENIILPFIQSIKNLDKDKVALAGYKDYIDYYNEKIRKTSEKARKREKEEKEKYGNNFKSFEVRILRFLQTLGFSFDDYDLVSHLRDLNYSSTENTAIFHHSDAVKENDEIPNFLFVPKKSKVDRGKNVSYTYHSHAFVHTEEGMNTIKKFLRILSKSTENNDSEILNDLQFLNWNQDSIELAKSRLIDFNWVHNIYEYLPKYGDWKKINFMKLNRLVGKYLHPNFKKSLKIIKQDFKKSWERYLERKKEYRKKKYENIQ